MLKAWPGLEKACLSPRAALLLAEEEEEAMARGEGWGAFAENANEVTEGCKRAAPWSEVLSA